MIGARAYEGRVQLERKEAILPFEDRPSAGPERINRQHHRELAAPKRR